MVKNTTNFISNLTLKFKDMTDFKFFYVQERKRVEGEKCYGDAT